MEGEEFIANKFNLSRQLNAFAKKYQGYTSKIGSNIFPGFLISL